jgi:predicted O-methyltransferase YrrM
VKEDSPMAIQSGEELLALMRGYQIPCVLAAAADLDVFNALAAAPRTARETAAKLGCDARATTILLDALSGVGLLVKTADHYALAPALAPLLVDSSPQSVAAMLRHQANCLRRWARLPWVVQSGAPADPGPSLRGPEADDEAFIEAMNVVSGPVAEQLVREVDPGEFRCVLDVGGASGTWTLAWLKAQPSARAILLDLPAVIPMARERIASSAFAARVDLVAGDYLRDPLPRGADLVWISAIIHQNSRAQNRELYRRVAEAIDPGGLVLIRDVVMEPSRTAPTSGALFAVNMLVATEGGNAFTLAESRDDLMSAGFADVRLVRRDEGMHSVVSARLTA